MRFLVGLIVSLVICCTEAEAAPKLLWETKGLAQPESVVVDPATGAIYVSNIVGAVMQKDGNGFIAKLNGDGKVVTRQWVKGLDSPTGLALHDRTLYVADVDQLVEINAASGEIVKRYPAKGATFLNDLRQTIGRANFDAFVRDLYQRSAYHLLTTPDLFTVLKDHTGVNVQRLRQRYFR